jgi:hypothetical protein
MQLEVIGHLADAIGEQRYLDLGGARVGLASAKFTRQLLFPFFGKWHYDSRVFSSLMRRALGFDFWQSHLSTCCLPICGRTKRVENPVITPA